MLIFLQFSFKSVIQNTKKYANDCMHGNGSALELFILSVNPGSGTWLVYFVSITHNDSLAKTCPNHTFSQKCAFVSTF